MKTELKKSKAGEEMIEARDIKNREKMRRWRRTGKGGRECTTR